MFLISGSTESSEIENTIYNCSFIGLGYPLCFIFSVVIIDGDVPIILNNPTTFLVLKSYNSKYLAFTKGVLISTAPLRSLRA